MNYPLSDCNQTSGMLSPKYSTPTMSPTALFLVSLQAFLFKSCDSHPDLIYLFFFPNSPSPPE